MPGTINAFNPFSKNLVPVSGSSLLTNAVIVIVICNYHRIINGWNEAHNDLDKKIDYQLENSEQQFKTVSG